MLSYMLDTNIVIYTIKNRPEKVRKAVNAHAGQLCISAITYSELVYGAKNSQRSEENLRDVERFSAHLSVLSLTDRDAAHAGDIRADMKSKGRSIGAYDLMIAGHARSRGLILVTNNMKEFKAVSGLRLENWTR